MKFSKMWLCLLVGLAGIFQAEIGVQAISTSTASCDRLNKVIIYPSGNETISQLRQSGIARVDSYGSYWIAEVTDQQLNAVEATYHERAIEANYLNHIELRATSIDTTTEPALTVDGEQAKGAGRRLRLVQFKGPVQPEWLAQLKSLKGIKVINYVPHNAYLIFADATTERAIEALRSPTGPVQWIGEFRPSYKVVPALQKGDGLKDVTVALVDAPEAENALGFIDSFAQKASPSIGQMRNQQIIKVRVDAAALAEIARLPEVLWIDPIIPIKPADEVQALIVSSHTNNLVGFGPVPPPTGETYLHFLTNSVGGGNLPTGMLPAFTNADTYPIVDIADSGFTDNTADNDFFPFGNPAEGFQRYRVVYAVNDLSCGPYTFAKSTYGTNNLICIPPATIGGDDMSAIPHGTAIASIIAGYNVTDPDPSGFQFGMGISPFGLVGSTRVFQPDIDVIDATSCSYNIFETFCVTVLSQLIQNEYFEGGRIANASWAQLLVVGQNDGLYDGSCQTYDIGVRDAFLTGQSGSNATPLPFPQNQELIVVCANGNAGSEGNVGGFADITVTPPGVAKNVISVGATENIRLDGSGCLLQKDQDDAYNIASYSSFGPTRDGRFKPEIVAPGGPVYAVGAGFWTNYPTETSGVLPVGIAPGNLYNPTSSFLDPATNYFCTVNDDVAARVGGTNIVGTSYSAPAVSGAIQLLWWYFQNRLSMLQPSPAMAKAYLLNSARYLPITNALYGVEDSLPSVAQGMGELDLRRMFDGVPRILRDESSPRAIDTPLVTTNPIPQQTYFTRSGQSYEVSGQIASNNLPFRVTLAWTDAPGTPGNGSELVNDLNLEVTVGGQTYFGNRFNGHNSIPTSTGGAAASPDNINPVESVFLDPALVPAVTSGAPWQVVVRAANIADTAVYHVGTNGTPNQDFALVVYNSVTNFPLVSDVPISPSLLPALTTNNLCSTALEIIQFPYSFTNMLTTNSVYSNVQPSPSVARGGIDEFFKITQPTPGTVFTVDTFGSVFDTVLSVWSAQVVPQAVFVRGECGFLSEVVANNDAAGGTNGVQSQVTFTADGSNDYFIVVEPHNDGPGGTMVLNVQATKPPILVSPSTLTFPNQVVGTTSASQTVTYQNNATIPILISSATISNTGTLANGFTITSQTCGGNIIATGANCFVSIAYQPTVAGTNQAELVFVDNATGSPRSIPITGIATPVAPLVCLSSASLPAFPSQLVTSTSAVQTITITNCGSDVLTVSNVTVTGSGSGDFVVTQGCTSGSPIAAGATCAINVAFAPQTNGTRLATLTVTDDAAGSPRTFLLQGDGTPLTPAVCPSGSPVSFGAVYVSSTSSVQSVIITNCGTAPLFVSSVVLSGANAGDFQITSSGCSTVAVGATCAVGVTFAPTATGTRTATLTINDNTATSPDHVTLIGVGSGIKCTATITVSPSVLPGPQVGIPYNQSLTASGAKAPATYFLAIGPLPPGLSLSSAGVISGTPTKSGQFTFEIGLTDANGCPGSQLYTVFVSCPTLSLSPSSLPGGTEFVAYNPQTFTASGGTIPYTYAQTAGALPAGMSISTNGVLSGTPTSPSSTFTVTATDSNNCSVSQVYTLTLVDPMAPITITPTNLVTGVVGQSYDHAFVASGGEAPYSFTNSNGSLPPGLSLSSSGTLTGVPTTAGLYSFMVTTTDHTPTNSQTVCSITITSQADLAVSSLFSPNPVTVVSNLTCSIVVTNIGPSPATGVVVSNTLPAGAIFLSASSGCAVSNGTLICDVGSIAAGASVSLSYTVTATETGLISATSTVTANETDTNLANNSFTAYGSVSPPFTTATDPGAITDVDGDTVSISLKGAGNLNVHLLGGSSNGPIDSIVLTNTDATSTLTIKVKRGPHGDGLVNIGSIVSDGGLKSISGKDVNITGAGIQLGGSLGTISINALSNSTLAVDGSIKTVTVKTFTASLITATQVGSVKINTIPTTNNNGQEFGVVVQQAAKGTVSVTNPRLKWKIATEHDQSSGDFHVKY